MQTPSPYRLVLACTLALTLALLAIPTSAALADTFAEQGDAGNSANAAQRAVTAGPLTTITGAVTPTNDTDMFCVRALDGTLTLETVTGSDPVVYVLRADGSYIAGNDDGGPGLESYLSVPVDAGPYIVAIVSYGSYYSFGYTMSLTGAGALLPADQCGVSANTAPTVTFAGEAERTYGEGTTERIFDYTVTDDSGTPSITTSCGAAGEKVSDGDPENDGTRTLRCLFKDGDASSTVTASATDAGNLSGSDSVAVTVSNLAPTVTAVTAPAGELVLGQSSDWSFEATDPSPVDQQSLEFAVDWDDGSTGSGSPASHAWAQPGDYLVSVVASDKDGASSDPDTADAFVGGSLDAPAKDGFPRTVMLGGTTGGDSYNVKRVGTSVVVTQAGSDPRTYTVPSTTEIVLMGGPGDDTMLVESSVLQQVIAVGGAGNDTLDVRSPSAIVAGGDGDDKVLGNDFGRDLLFGGDGLDIVEGKAGEDVLVAGRIPWERATPTARRALESLQVEWLRTTVAFASRVAHLAGTSGGALNTVFLKPGGQDRTVFDDIAVDTLTGGTGNDWLVANRVLPGTLDTVVGTGDTVGELAP